MSLMDVLFGEKRETSASKAKERLQIILAHERTSLHDGRANFHWLPELQKELLSVVAKYIEVDQDALTINIERRENIELLEINVTLPEKD
ncbi:MAG: hypothetical protein RLZZ293_1217 [Pseudomonadota bacterium]|jgi:cell division topological specificity factor